MAARPAGEVQQGSASENTGSPSDSRGNSAVSCIPGRQLPNGTWTGQFSRATYRTIPPAGSETSRHREPGPPDPEEEEGRSWWGSAQNLNVWSRDDFVDTVITAT